MWKPKLLEYEECRQILWTFYSKWTNLGEVKHFNYFGSTITNNSIYTKKTQGSYTKIVYKKKQIGGKIIFA